MLCVRSSSNLRRSSKVILLACMTLSSRTYGSDAMPIYPLVLTLSWSFVGFCEKMTFFLLTFLCFDICSYFFDLDLLFMCLAIAWTGRVSTGMIGKGLADESDDEAEMELRTR